MSLRNMTVQYTGDTLYLPPLEREVKHIIVYNDGLNGFKHFEPIVHCKDCMFSEVVTVRYSDRSFAVCLADWCEGSEGVHPIIEPDGFCSYGERKNYD